MEKELDAKGEMSYWKKETETMPRDRLQNLQVELFRNQMQYVSERSPFYQRKYDVAGIKPSDSLYVPFGYGLHMAWWGNESVR